MMTWLLAHWQAVAGVGGAVAVALVAALAYLRGRSRGGDASQARQTEAFEAAQHAAEVAGDDYTHCIEAIDLAHPGDAGARDRILHKADLASSGTCEHCDYRRKPRP